MNSLAEFFVNFINWNKEVDFGLVIGLTMAYILIFWTIVSIWVYKDAKRRFEKRWLAALVAILNFLMSFPFLVLYLLIRPAILDDFEELHEGGVNVPIVNFVGKQGVEMSFELRIHPSKMAAKPDSEMQIDVSFLSADPDKQVVEKSDSQLVASTTATASNVGGSLAGVSGKVGNFFRNIKLPAKTTSTAAENTPVSAEASTTLPLSNSSLEKRQGKSKKKKKRRH